MNSNYLYAYISRAIAYGKKGNYGAAISDYTRAIELNPKDRAPFDPGDSSQEGGSVKLSNYFLSIELQQAYIGRALACLKSGRAAQGLPGAERALETFPRDSIIALNVGGDIFEASGRRQEAIAGYRRALAQEPSTQATTDVLKDALKRLGAAP